MAHVIWADNLSLAVFATLSLDKVAFNTQQLLAWADDQLAGLSSRTRIADPNTTKLVGREAALQLFEGHLRKTPIVKDKGEFVVFVASGHVRAGKTRLGLELGKFLEESAVYVLVELGNGKGYEANFDGSNRDNHRDRLGGRHTLIHQMSSGLFPRQKFLT